MFCDMSIYMSIPFLFSVFKWRHQNSTNKLSRGITDSTYKFSVRKGSSFCNRGRLNVRVFEWRVRLARAAWKAILWAKNVLTIFWDFATLTFLNCLRINITLLFMSSSSNDFVGKLKGRCFCWFLAAIFNCAPQKDTNMASPYQAL